MLVKALQVAVEDGGGVGADYEVVARRERDHGQVDGAVDGCVVTVDQSEAEAAEVDRRRAGVLDLDELRGVGARLVVVDLVDDQRRRAGLEATRGIGELAAPGVMQRGLRSTLF